MSSSFVDSLMQDSVERVNQLTLDELTENAGFHVEIESGADTDGLRDAVHALRAQGHIDDDMVVWAMHPSMVDELATVVDHVEVEAQPRFIFPVLTDETLDEGQAFLIDTRSLAQTPMGVAKPFVVKDPNGVVRVTTDPYTDLREKMEELESLTEECQSMVSEVRSDLDSLD